MNKVGAYIKKKRMEHGISVSELAQKIGVTEKQMEDLERKEGFPNICIVEPLCTQLGCTVTQLLSGDDDANADALLLMLLCKIASYKSLGIALIGLIITQLSLNARTLVSVVKNDFLYGLCQGISSGVTIAGVCLFAYGLSLFQKNRDKK